MLVPPCKVNTPLGGHAPQFEKHCSSSFKLVECPTHRPKGSQICSNGDKSVDRATQGRVVTVRRQSCDTLAVRGQAFS
ncbi:hypothetical protein TNCV_3877471 [Trichonephila clavipes]|uniref:Uncharacterized protein n=1 Tax=Trichonephila clavipes TaxID=2585209 RepID=A0A8X6VRH7_TRICX|nr:hypothetical protein TNCV_3877471 [Trichonephila clavipes]